MDWTNSKVHNGRRNQTFQGHNKSEKLRKNQAEHLENIPRNIKSSDRPTGLFQSRLEDLRRNDCGCRCLWL